LAKFRKPRIWQAPCRSLSLSHPLGSATTKTGNIDPYATLTPWPPHDISKGLLTALTPDLPNP